MTAQGMATATSGTYAVPHSFFSQRQLKPKLSEPSFRLQRDERILEHLDYAYQLIHSILNSLPSIVDRENLIAAGLLGLTEAAGQFQPERGVPFKTFAFPRIRGAVIDELRRNSPLPQRMLKDIAIIRDAMEKMEPPHTVELLHEQTGLSAERIEECISGLRMGSPQNWEETSKGIEPSLDSKFCPDYRINQMELMVQLQDCLEHLSDRERDVLIMYHVESAKLREIGLAFGISESRTSRVLDAAETKVREMMARRDATLD